MKTNSSSSETPVPVEDSQAPVPDSPAAQPIDVATRGVLSRLSSLIRTQFKAEETANEIAKAEVLREESEAAGREARNKRALKAVQDTGQDDLIARESVDRADYPTVERIDAAFQREKRKRGARVYEQQKTKDVVSLILADLEKAKPAESMSDAESEDLEVFLDSDDDPLKSSRAA